MAEKIRLGISRCLLGEPVCFDGGHRRDAWMVEVLGRYVEYVPVCPEEELGLPTPRESLRLTGDPQRPRLVFSGSGQDITEAMEAWARRRTAELEKEDLCGFIFRGRPLPGGVKLYDAHGLPAKKGVALFARIFMEHFPLIPVEEDSRLQEPDLRENFIERLFTFKRWRETLAGGRTRGELADFHARHKLLILSRSPEMYREMGRLVAEADQLAERDLFRRYEALLMRAMRLAGTTKKHVNVLQHLFGSFKERLSDDEKREALEAIGRYGRGEAPLMTPVALLNHLADAYGEDSLKRQVYLHPHPLELALRNQVQSG